MDSTEPTELPPAQALALAERARAAALAPRPVPAWYGRTIAVALAVYGIGQGHAHQAGPGRLSGLLGGSFVALSAALAVLVTRSGGVRQVYPPGHRRFAVLALLRIGGAGAAAAGLATLANGDVRWVAGTAAGAAFWLTFRRFNARIRRDAGAAG